MRQRVQEVGIRLALGAMPRNLVERFPIENGIVVCLGVASGLLIAVWTARSVQSMVFRVTSHDPVTYLTVCGLIAMVSAAAILLPALGVVRMNPARSLRAE